MLRHVRLQKLGRLTVREFFARFPDDDACLEHIMEVRFGKRHTCRVCGNYSTFHRLTNRRRAFACAHCGDNLYPTANTIFMDTRTPLQVWFYAIYLFVTTRHGVSGKELERTLGVTYKTAWRMGQQIRILMAKADGFEMLQGHIEMDEAYVGGHRPGKRGRGAHGKTIVFGMKQRGGRIQAKPVPDARKQTIRPIVLETVQQGSIVSTDEFGSYILLKGDGYNHGHIEHRAKEWVHYADDGVKHHTNSVESFWKLFKDSIRSTHIHVSSKYMDRYLKEFTFRSNHREMQNAMFDLLIAAV
jgi:transposase-like protein